MPSAQSAKVKTVTALLHKESFQWPDLSAWMKDGTDKNHNKKASEVPLRFGF